MRLSFVCLGNICRSPMAAAVMRHLAQAEGRDDITVDSAGTGSWHVGDRADPRTAAELARRGVPLQHTARQFTVQDFDRTDLVLAMDHDNASALRRLAPDTTSAAKVRMLREFDPSATHLDVPDPYYGGASGFAGVYDMVEAACRGLLTALPRDP